MDYKVKHIIWDCDGCLMDSEVVACDVVAACYRDVGYDISTEDFIFRFAGKNKFEIAKIIELETGIDFANKINPELKAKLMEDAFKTRLEPIDGIQKLLEGLKQKGITFSIASGSSLERLHLTLAICGLVEYFKDAVFSSEMVEHGKPAPDIFLYAAKVMGYSPAECIVIGDSVFDIKGATAAGMKSIALFVASHCNANWQERVQGAKPGYVAESIGELVDILKRSSCCHAITALNDIELR